MQSVTNETFGPLIAYLVPGATALWGISEFVPSLRSWFAIVPMQTPTIGGFLYLTVASIASGMVVNAVRWAVVDTFHRLTGLPVPKLDFSKLGPNVDAFNLLIEIHYRHYQFFGGMVVATAIAYLSHRLRNGGLWPLEWGDLGFLLIEAIFLTTSRDTARKYYERGTQLLGCSDGKSKPQRRFLLGRSRPEREPLQEVEQRDTVELAEERQFDHVNPPLARLAFRNKRRMASKLPTDLGLRKPGL